MQSNTPKGAKKNPQQSEHMKLLETDHFFDSRASPDAEQMSHITHEYLVYIRKSPTQIH